MINCTIISIVSTHLVELVDKELRSDSCLMCTKFGSFSVLFHMNKTKIFIAVIRIPACSYKLLATACDFLNSHKKESVVRRR